MLKAAADTLADLIQKTGDAIPLTLGPTSKRKWPGVIGPDPAADNEVMLEYQDGVLGVTLSWSRNLIVYEVWSTQARPSYHRDEPDDVDIIVHLTTPSTVRAVEQLFMTYLEGRLEPTIRDLWEATE